MASYKDAAAAVLSEAGRPLSAAEITKRAMDGGILEARGATPEASMGAAIYMEIKKLGEKSRFEKAGSATFKLRSQPPGKPAKHADEYPESGHIGVSGKHVGAAGEHRVVSELLFREYNADRTNIDDGIDITARKNGYMFNVQVKTVTGKDNRHVVTIRKESFDRHDSPQMYYVFVLRDAGNRLDFVILSSKEIRKRISRKCMTENKAGYQAIFSRKGDKMFLGRCDVTESVNDWDFGLP